MKVCLLLATIVALAASANDNRATSDLPKPPDKEKVSYALGMNLAAQRKRTDANVDVSSFLQGLRDVLDLKPTQMKDSEAVEILNQARVNRLNDIPETNREKVGYALGMRMGGQLTRVSADVDADKLVEGFNDVLEGKPTRVAENDIEPLLQQAKAYDALKQSEKNKTDGEAFLAKNAKASGVSVLPDGLQYRVLEKGSGEVPTTNDLIIVKYRGKFVNGAEFDRSDHFLTRSSGGMVGWQESLQRMNVGSKWQIFVPSELAFGHEGEAGKQIGADATLIYDLELVSIAHPGDPLVGTGTVGHGLDGVLEATRAAK